MGPELYVFKYINGNIYAEETSHANVIVFYIQFYKEIQTHTERIFKKKYLFKVPDMEGQLRFMFALI